MGRRNRSPSKRKPSVIDDISPNVSYRNGVGVFTRDEFSFRGEYCSRESCCPSQHRRVGRSRRDISPKKFYGARQPRSISCSTCSSCDSCSSDGTCCSDSLYGSLIASTEASFYRKDIRRHNSYRNGRQVREPSPVRYPSPVRNGRGASYAGNLHHVGDSRRSPQRYAPRRTRSFNDCTSIHIETFDGRPENHAQSHRRKYMEDKTKLHRMKITRNTDSGIGRGSNSGSSQSSRRKEYLQSSPNRKIGRNRDTENKAHFIHHMVSQTKEHRKLIKTLENELEKLRNGADNLVSCEVSQKDVEWRPGDIVGEGSFSTVYKGTFCGTEVAVKELKLKLSQDDKNYFKSEAALLQQLHHPRVVLLMGVCTAAARPFMILEYLSGGTLHTLIHSTLRERLDHAMYFSVAKDIAQGMNFLHRHDPQVLHLDLKSMNVLLDGYSRAKIADFGFSILRRPRNGSAVQKGSIRGTPAYMAPELLMKGEVSTKCDVYSYSIIMWEMLTVSHPFKGLDVLQIMENVEGGLRLPLPSSGISQDLRELITSCWAHNAALRPSFEEILGALESASLPSSWRNVLQRANIPVSAFSDIPLARDIIDVIERSYDTLYPRKKQNKKVTQRGRIDERKHQPSRRTNSPVKGTPRTNKVHSPVRGHPIKPTASNQRHPSPRRQDISRDRSKHYKEPNYKYKTSLQAEGRSKSSSRHSPRSNSRSRSIEESYFSGSGSSNKSYEKDYREKDRHHDHNPVRYISPERSPRRSISPSKREKMKPDHSRRSDHSRSQLGPNRYGAIITSEQLLNQKQRLRPVRPTGLRDLSDLPPNSINDISLVLQQAIKSRRKAHGYSGKENWRSNDPDWSDWAT